MKEVQLDDSDNSSYEDQYLSSESEEEFTSIQFESVVISYFSWVIH
jgi:hypothetical protein